MLEVIPAIDLKGGNCVRLTRGDFSQVNVYHPDPVQQAIAFEQTGFKRLHLVDLDGALQGNPVHLQVLHKIRERTSLIIDYSGGIRSSETANLVFSAGSQMIGIGSLGVKEPEVLMSIIEANGADRVILGADIRNRMIAVSGWTDQTREEMIPYLNNWKNQGIVKVMVTDITRDGTLEGIDTALYRELRDAFPEFHIIASGGVRGYSDIENLDDIGIQGVIVGKALYEGTLTPKELGLC
jgi:phosphoribosylformimino-5-aminoimidazole carboxamide ribotide isomerase